MIYSITYIWLGAQNFIRNKIRVIDLHKPILENIPEWNYDGSSTGQSLDIDTEITIKPVKMIKNPIDNDTDYIVLCDTYDSSDHPLITNHRHRANEIFRNNSADAWYGLEIEYFIINPTNPSVPSKPQFTHYCGFDGKHDIDRKIVMTHLQACIDANLHISGINAEVVQNQWEYQIGPCQGIDSADNVILSKFLLIYIAEYFGRDISFVPKLYENVNGSGCHVNFSTKETRDNDNIYTIEKYIEKLKNKHLEHMSVYGDNSCRMTGHHETAHYDEFTHGIGTRHTSIRIPNKTKQYFEDRRPSSSIDYYEVTSKIYETCCL